MDIISPSPWLAWAMLLDKRVSRLDPAIATEGSAQLYRASANTGSGMMKLRNEVG